tara:strand:- start:105 stop:314 length:210 start_codon:yes stop_codon:yes gene_type:complete
MNSMPGDTNSAYANMLRKENGQTFNNPPMGSLSNRSPGDQQMAQKQMENGKTSVLQRTAEFLQAIKRTA